VIRFEDAALRYDEGEDVLQDMTFHLLPGSFYFLAGPSGAGKSTLLRLLFMSLKPTRGSVHLFGKNTSNLDPEERAKTRRRIGIVFQDFRLLDHMTTWENISLPLRVHGRKPSEYRDDVTELLKWVGLGNRMVTISPSQPSGDQIRKKTSVASAPMMMNL